MDPNSPAPIQSPEQQPITPTSAPEQPPTPAPQQPVPGGQPPKKLSKGAIFAIIGGALLIVLLIVGIIIGVNAMNSEKTIDSNKNSNSSSSETTNNDPEPEAITAKKIVELRVACVGGSASNAATYKKPYSYVIYENNNKYSHNPELREQSLVQPYKDDYDWDMYGVGTNDEGLARTLSTNSEPSELNVVVCLDRDDSTAVKKMTCELNRSAGMEEGASTVANYSSVKYKVILYEAQSGKKITELGSINGPADECPATAYYTPESPDIYGDPDATELDAKLKDFEQ